MQNSSTYSNVPTANHNTRTICNIGVQGLVTLDTKNSMEKAKKLDYLMANVRADLNVKGCGMAHPIKTQKMETMYVLLTSHCKPLRLNGETVSSRLLSDAS